MPKPIKIAIPSPCHENWDNMTATQQGRFCASCQKPVIDFTSMTDRQVAAILKKDKTVCGRFLNTQLDRELSVPREKNPAWAVAGAAAIALVALGTTPAHAQEPQKTEQTQSKPVSTDEPATPATGGNGIISGTVHDEDGDIIEGAQVTNKNTGKKTVTDAKGNYSIEAHPGDVLRFKSDETTPTIIPVTHTTTTLNVRLSYVSKVMGSPRYF